MIIDSIALGGDKAYFDFGTPRRAAARIPVRPLGAGQAYAVSGIRLQLEADDLRPLFHRRPDALLQVRVHKEMFPALFAAPYEHRVHNISGYEDFNRGVSAGCKAIDVEGIPTLVSFGDSGECSWTSPIYRMPGKIAIGKLAWDLAVSRLTPEVAFTYSIGLNYWVRDLNPRNETSVPVVTDANPTELRNNAELNLPDDAIAYSITFSAKIRHDSNLNEAYAANPFEAAGTPLLRAVYLLEEIDPPLYQFFSLKEVLDHCVEVHLFETPGPKVSKLTATLALDALLVQSDNQVPAGNHNPALADNYEFLELRIAPLAFTYVEAMVAIRETVTPPKPIQQP